MKMAFSKEQSLVWIQAMLVILALAAREDDENYVKKYGTDRMTSGVWKPIGTYPYGDEKLAKIAREAHRAAGMGEVNVHIAVKESRWLDFYDRDKLDSIKIDVLVYAVEDLVKNDTQIPYFFYITKGLEPDCVYYLTKDDLEAINLKLHKHVCGVELPS